jgi:hypothetical protein
LAPSEGSPKKIFGVAKKIFEKYLRNIGAIRGQPKKIFWEYFLDQPKYCGIIFHFENISKFLF